MGKKYIRKVYNIRADPLKVIPEDVYEHVFQYLSTSDLLRSSLVSKEWYQKIAKCNKFKKQIRLKYSGRNHEDEIKFIKKSCREYSDIVINLPDLAKKRINYESNIRLILEKFASSVTSIDTTHDAQRICDLPNLKNLILRASTLFSKGITSKIKFVEKLKFSYLSRLGSIVLARAFRNTVNLKSLEFNMCFIKSIEACNMSLTEAIIHGYQHQCDESPFLKFILAQKSTLEVLFLSESIVIRQLINILENFPKLHTLGINNNIIYGQSEIIDTTANETIQTLIVINNFRNYNGGLKVISFLRNLKVLRVSILNSSVLEAVALSSSITRVEYRVNFLLPDEIEFLDQSIEFVHCNIMHKGLTFRF